MEKEGSSSYLVSVPARLDIRSALTIDHLERGDPEKRPFLTRIYGMVGCLIVSLVLIVVLVILQKKLPDGAGSYFHIPVRRDLGNENLQPRDVAREGK